ncbi:MAG: MarR family transcriptional regulator [Longimicrobiales bacterium]|nr:MarR family transcriptional regulator [Longimicrobiales bacterium]
MQARILRQLDASDPAMVGELAEYFRVTPSTMSLNLKRLEEAGLIRRSRDPDDGRVMNVRLTEAGVRVKTRSSALDPQKVDALLQILRPEERVRAVSGLRLLLDAVSRLSTRKHDYLQALTEGGGPAHLP